MFELIEMIKKDNSLNTTNYGTFFVFWNITLKVCNNACILRIFGKKRSFIHFYSAFLK